MDINIKELQQVTEKIFLALRENDVETINLTEDYYWEIPEESLYKMSEKPKDFMAGQLSDDWNELQRLLDKDEIAHPFHDLAHLSSLLRYIAEHY